MNGERKLKFGDVEVYFDKTSLIVFSEEDIEISIDPTDLSVIYGAYRQMEKEKLDID